MHDEFYEGFHYVVEDKEPVEREFFALEERLQDQSKWIALVEFDDVS